MTHKSWAGTGMWLEKPAIDAQGVSRHPLGQAPVAPALVADEAVVARHHRGYDDVFAQKRVRTGYHGVPLISCPKVSGGFCTVGTPS